MRIGADTPELGAEVERQYDEEALRLLAPRAYLLGRVLGRLLGGFLYALVAALIGGALYGAIQVIRLLGRLVSS